MKVFIGFMVLLVVCPSYQQKDENVGTPARTNIRNPAQDLSGSVRPASMRFKGPSRAALRGQSTAVNFPSKVKSYVLTLLNWFQNTLIQLVKWSANDPQKFISYHTQYLNHLILVFDKYKEQLTKQMNVTKGVVLTPSSTSPSSRTVRPIVRTTTPRPPAPTKPFIDVVSEMEFRYLASSPSLNDGETKEGPTKVPPIVSTETATVIATEAATKTASKRATETITETPTGTTTETPTDTISTLKPDTPTIIGTEFPKETVTETPGNRRRRPMYNPLKDPFNRLHN